MLGLHASHDGELTPHQQGRVGTRAPQPQGGSSVWGVWEGHLCAGPCGPGWCRRVAAPPGQALRRQGGACSCFQPSSKAGTGVLAVLQVSLPCFLNPQIAGLSLVLALLGHSGNEPHARAQQEIILAWETRACPLVQKRAAVSTLALELARRGGRLTGHGASQTSGPRRSSPGHAKASLSAGQSGPLSESSNQGAPSPLSPLTHRPPPSLLTGLRDLSRAHLVPLCLKSAPHTPHSRPGSHQLCWD